MILLLHISMLLNLKSNGALHGESQRLKNPVGEYFDRTLHGRFSTCNYRFPEKRKPHRKTPMSACFNQHFTHRCFYNASDLTAEGKSIFGI